MPSRTKSTKTKRRPVERRLLEPYDSSGMKWRDQIVHNFRVLRNFTQQDAAEWWGVSVRTWQRYEAPSGYAPEPLLKRIRAWVLRSCPEYIHYVS